jgi:hypothetical protein
MACYRFAKSMISLEIRGDNRWDFSLHEIFRHARQKCSRQEASCAWGKCFAQSGPVLCPARKTERGHSVLLGPRQAHLQGGRALLILLKSLNMLDIYPCKKFAGSSGADDFARKPGG